MFWATIMCVNRRKKRFDYTVKKCIFTGVILQKFVYLCNICELYKKKFKSVKLVFIKLQKSGALQNILLKLQ